MIAHAFSYGIRIVVGIAIKAFARAAIIVADVGHFDALAIMAFAKGLFAHIIANPQYIFNIFGL